MTTLPTDVERAQARAEHLADVAECFELLLDDGRPVIGMYTAPLRWLVDPHHAVVPSLRVHADLDEARAIRDRLAELIEDAERGGAV